MSEDRLEYAYEEAGRVSGWPGARDTIDSFLYTIAQRASTADVVALLGKVGVDVFERKWLCDYPEFNDPNCRPDAEGPTWQPRKHTGCGWRVIARLPDKETA